MLKAAYYYSIASFFRFLLSLYLTLKILSLLEVDEYSLYGLVNAFSMLFALLWLFNIDSSLQKLYSKNLIRGSVNIALIFILLFLSMNFIILVSLIQNLLPSISSESAVFTIFEIQHLYFFCAAITINAFLLSYLNARKFHKNFMAMMIIPNLIVCINLFQLENLKLSELLALQSSSIFYSALILFVLNIKNVIQMKVSVKRIKFIIKYIFAYTANSIPTIGSKNILDFVIRTILLERFGHHVLASYNIVQSIFGIFRTLEQSISRAVTPYILQETENRKSSFRFASLMTKIQTVAALTAFCTSFFWLPILAKFFDNKPVEIFDEILLVLLGSQLIIGYWKNYYLIFMKHYQYLMRVFYNQTTVVNIMIALMYVYVPIDYYTLIILQSVMLGAHVVILNQKVKSYDGFKNAWGVE